MKFVDNILTFEKKKGHHEGGLIGGLTIPGQMYGNLDRAAMVKVTRLDTDDWLLTTAFSEKPKRDKIFDKIAAFG